MMESKGERNMEKLNVRMVKLEPMHVAAVLGFGPSPEMLAWEKLHAWIKAHGLPENAGRYFGFNNPDPAPGSPNYGYEQWITVGPQARPEGEVDIKGIPGNVYAVTRCRLANITETWKALVLWMENSSHCIGPGQCLEECLTPGTFLRPDGGDPMQALFDLYLPAAE
jgi:DNA gyrase inhibitor GyrI